MNASFYREIDPRWAVLGSVGWQQWSKFGEVDVGVDSNNPVGLTTEPRLQGHLARRRRRAIQVVRRVAAQRRHRLRLGVPGQRQRCAGLPANAAWRFGIGGQKEESRTFDWGWSLEYLYGGSLHTNISGSAPVALGGRGDVVGSFNDVGLFFFAANFNWKF